MELYDKIIESLPKAPTEGMTFWATDELILASTPERANALADLLDCVAGDQIAVTGFYDPAEDERNGETDRLTGFHYVDI